MLTHIPAGFERKYSLEQATGPLMSKTTAVSAGLLMYRRSSGGLEVLLVHPGGPFWKHRDIGAWSIPKGVLEPEEEPLTAACREFAEETGFISQPPYLDLGVIQQKAGKLVYAWGFEGDADPNQVKSNTVRVEVPSGSGRWLAVPEVDRAAWFAIPVARQRINAAQATFLDRLQNQLA
jgi:predicted NUDIX family NTP pyrophosphohydrolase